MDLDTLLAKSDVIFLHCPLFPETEGIINKDNPLLLAKNCIITPHISWAAQASRQRIMDITAENIRAFVEGAPVNVVNK